jgi:sulfoxide reductase heme-binding subunit YedZ
MTRPPRPSRTLAGLNTIRSTRRLIYLMSLIVAIVCYGYVTANTQSSSLSKIRLTEIYGFTAAAGLYLALIISPIYAVFSGLPGYRLLRGGRRAIGVSTCAFAVLHTLIGFFGLLGGWRGLSFLTPLRFTDVMLSAVALLILCALALTSSNRAQAALGMRWQTLHRLVYPAALLTLIHMIVVGAHFLRWGSAALLLTVVVLVLLVLEALRLSRHRVTHNDR